MSKSTALYWYDMVNRMGKHIDLSFFINGPEADAEKVVYSQSEEWLYLDRVYSRVIYTFRDGSSLAYEFRYYETTGRSAFICDGYRTVSGRKYRGQWICDRDLLPIDPESFTVLTALVPYSYINPDLYDMPAIVRALQDQCVRAVYEESRDCRHDRSWRIVTSRFYFLDGSFVELYNRVNLHTDIDHASICAEQGESYGIMSNAPYWRIDTTDI